MGVIASIFSVAYLAGRSNDVKQQKYITLWFHVERSAGPQVPSDKPTSNAIAGTPVGCGTKRVQDDVTTKGAKKRKSGFDAQWTTKYTWLRETSDSKEMLCHIHGKFNLKSSRNSSLVWNSMPCIIITKYAIDKRAHSEMHKKAMCH
ncbi:uncharacterized protein LOC144343701 [Saccoglossus kowalevskii]